MIIKKLNIHFFIAAMFAAVGFLHAADDKKTITQWPSYIYNEVYPGASFKFDATPAKLARIKAFALKRDKRNAAKLKDEHKEGYDWVGALLWAEKNLLKKPIKHWTVQDLCDLNAEVLKLTDGSPGILRTQHVWWALKDFNDDIKNEINGIMRKRDEGVQLPEDDEYVDEHMHFFLQPEKISHAMDMVVGLLKTLESEIDAAAMLHHYIISIHPWNGAHKRTARIAMYCLLGQYGHQPIRFEQKKYEGILVRNLKVDDNEFKNYLQELLLSKKEA